jgi:hypothetical protein
MDNNTILLIIQIILLPVQIASLIALIVYVVKTGHIASATLAYVFIRSYGT